jgi:hypothetical protein
VEVEVDAEEGLGAPHARGHGGRCCGAGTGDAAADEAGGRHLQERATIEIAHARVR